MKSLLVFVLLSISCLAGNPPPCPEIYYDSAAGGPFPSRPYLPIRISGYDVYLADYVILQSRVIGSEWNTFAVVQLDTVEVFYVGYNCDEIRAVAIYGEEQQEGPSTQVLQ